MKIGGMVILIFLVFGLAACQTEKHPKPCEIVAPAVVYNQSEQEVDRVEPGDLLLVTTRTDARVWVVTPRLIEGWITPEACKHDGK